MEQFSIKTSAETCEKKLLVEPQEFRKRLCLRNQAAILDKYLSEIFKITTINVTVKN
jgi:hypothetical protein